MKCCGKRRYGNFCNNCGEPLKTGKQLAKEGIRKSSLSATVGWKSTAYEAVKRAARKYPILTIDQVRECWPKELRWLLNRCNKSALGGVMLTAKENGIIEEIPGATRIAKTRSHHANPVREWKSLIYRGRKHATKKSNKKKTNKRTTRT